MSGSGRPLRFLAVTLGSWTAVRVAMLWPAAMAPVGAQPVLASRAASIAGSTPIHPAPWLSVAADRSPVTPWPVIPPTRTEAARRRSAGMVRLPFGWQPSAVTTAAAPAVVAGSRRSPIGALVPLPGPLSTARSRSRLAGSAWAIARGGGNGTLLGGQLGASQAGARLTYALGTARRIALSARFASPLRGSGKEAAIGIDWQPTRLPLHLLAEQRVSLDGQRGGPTLLVIGGIDPTPVLAGFRLEGYGEAGAIKRAEDAGGVEAFGDAALRLTRHAAVIGPAKVDLGGGMWGAAQRGVRRLDIGPTVGAVVPVAGKTLRVTLDCGIM